MSYGYDLTGDAYTGSNTPVPDADPWEGCNGHGTHVAGIIAAQANAYGAIGAAPGVTLGAYRVFGCRGQVSNDVLIDAYMRAYEAGSQIITASIGGSSGWSEDPWAVAVQRIVEKGVPCLVAAGNEGSNGMFYASTAANGKKVTGIASVDNVITPTLLVNSTMHVGSVSKGFGWSPGEPAQWGGVHLPLWALSFDTTDPANGCDPYPDSTPDLSGYIVLIRRGTCTFVQKATNAAAKGARYVIIYNNVPTGANGPAAGVDGIKGIAMVTAKQGEEWVSLLASGQNVTLDMEDPETAPKMLSGDPNTVTGGFMSTFTTWGPTFEMDAKPQFGAPGGAILATYPVPLGEWAVLSGTSMATPMAAAVVALIAEARKTFDPATIENLLAATANPNLFNNGRATTDLLAPVAQQGAGLIQAYDAAKSTTLLSVSSLSFNDTANAAKSLSFGIKNLGTAEVVYDLSNVPAATAFTFPADGSIYPSLFPPELSAAAATLSFSSSKVTVAPDASATITVTATPPTGLDAKRLPLWSGYVAINASSGESLSIPYQGLAGSLKAAQVLDTDPSATYLFASTDPNMEPAVSPNTSFVLPKPGTPESANKTYPAVAVSLAMGSPLLRIDVVRLDGGLGGYDAGAPDMVETEVLGERVVGSLPGFPMEYLSRDPFPTSFTGQLDDGSWVGPGRYKLVIRALRITGDKHKASDYDRAETVEFTVSYAK